ncbi:MAG: hypothetical protein IT165_18145 [Bryobacterales bacterium]|nr:hypothetical protein [Bryobacterales bacterium]
MMRPANQFLLAGAIVLLVACGRHAPAPPTTSTLRQPTARVVPVKPPAPAKTTCVTPPPSLRPVYQERLADAEQLLKADAIEARQAAGAEKEVAADLQAARAQWKDDQAVLQQARATAFDAKERLDHDTMMARLGALAPMLVDQSRTAYAQAQAAVRSAQSAAGDAAAEVQLLMGQRQQLDARAEAAQQSLQHAASELQRARHELSAM